jgi:hypothetical protein
MSDDRDALNRLRRTVDELHRKLETQERRISYLAVSLDQLRDNLNSENDVRMSLLTFAETAYSEIVS